MRIALDTRHSTLNMFICGSLLRRFFISLSRGFFLFFFFCSLTLGEQVQFDSAAKEHKDDTTRFRFRSRATIPAAFNFFDDPKRINVFSLRCFYFKFFD